uniref:Alpha-aminoadipate reductase n=1 Tax=Ganoderma boninense TaxID=34458 RepID=A0A5K1JYM3_9APHY|nr:Alpha-aminoadipate reductase [Ganoderma boninense]
MSGKTPIFFIGATGFIGGAVLQAILAHPKANTFEITALVRAEAKAKALESTLGIKTVIGSLQDYALLTENAENAHVVFQIADHQQNCENRGQACKYCPERPFLPWYVRAPKTTQKMD